jgi:hypothetical protein
MRNPTITRPLIAIPTQRAPRASAVDHLATIVSLVEQARWLLRDGVAGPEGERLTAISGSPITAADGAEMITEPLDAVAVFAALAANDTAGGGALAQLLNVIAAHVDAVQVTQ